MDKERKSILLVEDDEAHAQLVGRAFKIHEERFTLSIVKNLEAARKMIAEKEHHLIITDLYLPDGSGSELLPSAGQETDYPVVVMTSYGNEQLAVEAMKAGALEYIVKSDASLNDMPHIAERALREWNHITERKKLEGQIRQAQKMEAVGTLAGGIAHDFNNLLMGIQGNTSLMLIDMDPGHPHFERLKNIEQCVKSGAELTQQLLGFARGGKFQVKAIDLNELIDRSIKLFGRTKKEIKIHTKYAVDLWTVEVDQGQIEQTLLNICVNAWQAMPGGGDLYIQTENQRSEKEAAPFVKVTVTDTGVGMDRATQEQIFEPFFSTNKEGGIGLGLSSAYGIVENHGGVIEVSSVEGEGTTFTILLPASEKKIEKKGSHRKTIIQGEGTVLLVDDEAMVLSVGERMLKKLGYKVLVSDSGEEAMKVFTSNQDEVELVILDVVMPEMGGLKVFEQMKQVKPDVKILLSSGYNADRDAATLLERGCDGYLQKPFDLESLSRIVGEILNA